MTTAHRAPRHVTVGFDGTTPSEEAVRWAADEAAARGAQLRIVRCFRIPVSGDAMIGFGYADALGVLEEVAEKDIKSMAASVSADHRHLHVSTAVIAGPVAPALVDGLGPDDLVVVGSSSHEGAAAFWLGSTPRRVIHISPCPVAVVRGAASRGRPDRVVVGIDGSDASLAALDWAGEEADRQHVAMLVVHGWTYPYSPLDAGSSAARDLMRIDAETILDRAVEHARDRFAAPVTGCLLETGPAGALVETVRDGDVLVIGSQGRGAVVNSVFGSTVNSVLERAAVPVIVVHPPHLEPT